MRNIGQYNSITVNVSKIDNILIASAAHLNFIVNRNDRNTQRQSECQWVPYLAHMCIPITYRD